MAAKTLCHGKLLDISEAVCPWCNRKGTLTSGSEGNCELVWNMGRKIISELGSLQKGCLLISLFNESRSLLFESDKGGLMYMCKSCRGYVLFCQWCADVSKIVHPSSLMFSSMECLNCSKHISVATLLS